MASTGQSSTTDNSNTGFPDQVAQLVNKERAKVGASAIKVNDKLTRAAQKYCEVLATWGKLSHIGPDGSKLSTRVEAEGYKWSALGENIAGGQQTPAKAMESWMNSSGHRENILGTKFQEIGIGYHEGGGDGGPYWVQVFAAGS